MLKKSVIMGIKLKNAILRHAGDMNLQFTLKNIIVNGEKRGCSGFIRNLDNGSVVYTTTEESCASWLTFLYRRADDEKDYGSRRWYNQWTKRKDLDELAECICRLLAQSPADDHPCHS